MLLQLDRLLSGRTASSSSTARATRSSISSGPRQPGAFARRGRRATTSRQAEPAASSAASPAAAGSTSSSSSASSSASSVALEEGLVLTTFIAETLLPTRYGRMRLRGYRHSVDGGLTYTEPTAIISGSVEGQEDVAVRVHDACFTSEVLGSLKCDCADQLNLALERIVQEPPGMVVYLQQEGRGIGLANKIAAYSLQEKGLDTVDANRALGLPDDSREYSCVRNILQGLGVKSIRLMTNNPRKINELKGLGIAVNGRIPCIVSACNEHNQGYMQAKQDRMSHILDGEFCFINHEGEPSGPLASAASLSSMGGSMDFGDAVVPLEQAERVRG